MSIMESLAAIGVVLLIAVALTICFGDPFGGES